MQGREGPSAVPPLSAIKFPGMADNITVEIDLDKVLRAMDAMESTAKEGSRAFRTAFRRCANTIKRSVVKSARTVTSNREKANLVKAVAYKSGLGASVNAWQGGYLKSGRFFNLKWLDNGTSDVIGRNGRKHGATPAKPFFWQGVDSAMGAATDQLEGDLMDALIKAYGKR